MERYRISGGNLIRDGRIEKSDLLISEGKIYGVIPPSQDTRGEYVSIDATGMYVCAGFVDIHQHGGGGSDYMDGGADTYLRATEAHLAHGTTSVMPTLLSANTELTCRAIENYKKAKNDHRIRASLLGLHLEGPYISPYQAGAQRPEHIRRFDPVEYRRLTELAEGNIKRWSVAPEVDGADAFAKYATAQGITLSIAHSNADFDTVLRAYEKGFRHVTHFYSCLSSVTRINGFRVAGAIEAAYYLDGMNVEIIADGCHLPHSLLAYVSKFKNVSQIALVTDAMRAAGENRTSSFLGGFDDPTPVIIEDGVAKLEDRSAFAGSVATADRLVLNMVRSGVSIADAVSMMTVNPIRMMGLDVKKGELRCGYDADVCIFDENINIQRVFCGGTPVYAR